MSGKGFTKDKVGMLLSTTFEIKTNGLGEILYMVKKQVQAPRHPKEGAL
jgi:uncharacterized protein (DUF3820 family)